MLRDQELFLVLALTKPSRLPKVVADDKQSAPAWVRITPAPDMAPAQRRIGYVAMDAFYASLGPCCTDY